MAKFKDNSSGQIYEFATAYDVEQMRKHPDYTEVLETQKTPKEETSKSKA
jgi:hypothetical protein